MNNCFKLELQADVLFKGERAYTNISKFQEIHYEITEGNELIGLCPYDVNKNYEDILFYRKIDIPINVENKIVKLENGELTFCVYPKYQYSKEAFSIGFAHHIIWKFDCAIDMEQIRKNLYIITDFFSVLAGESITVNSLNCVENDKLVEVIGICNFPKEKLNILKNDTIDYTSFKRGGLYKITDFQNLEQAMKYWFSNYKKIYNAQQAYGRILLDEDVKIVTINKFLAAMQLIEGYTQAYTDEEKEIKKFEEKKNEIISKLESEEEKELVGKGLGYSGISFRKAVKDYPYITDKEAPKLEKAEIWDLVKNIKALTVTKLSGILVNNTDNIVITYFKGLIATGLVSNYTLLINMLTSLVTQVFTSITASVGNLNAVGMKNRNTVFLNTLNLVKFLDIWLGICRNHSTCK